LGVRKIAREVIIYNMDVSLYPYNNLLFLIFSESFFVDGREVMDLLCESPILGTLRSKFDD
jgi:hypothetical protein